MNALYLGPHVAPSVGTIAVARRRGGGHDAVVIARIGNKVETVSPNSRGGLVRVVVYPVRHFLAFVRPVHV